MVNYFLSRQSAVAMILDRLRSLTDGQSASAETRVHIAELEQLLRDVRLGRQGEFVLPDDPPMRVVVMD